MKSAWSGVFDLGGLSVPVKLGASVKDNGLSLRQVRVSDGARIQYLRHAEGETEEVPWEEIGKGYDAPDGTLVIMTEDEQKAVYGDKNRVARIVKFTDAHQIPPMSAKTAYWVMPDVNGARGYAVLAEVLRELGKVAVIEYAMRFKMVTAVLRPIDGYLALESLEWDRDMIKPDFAAPVNTATEQEMDLTRQLVTAMTGKYDHEAQVDTSSADMMAAIQKKIDTGQSVTPPPSVDAPSKGATRGVGSVNGSLTDALKAAVAAHKTPEGEPTPVPAPRARRKTAAEKKVSA